MIFLFTAIAYLAPFVPARAVGLELESSCTDRWNSGQHPSGMSADKFGAVCINEGRSRPDPLTPEAIYALLQPMITAQSPLVTTPPRDVVDFCPGYFAASPETRADFWRRLVIQIARFESSFKPREMTWESNGQYSVGLLQLSASDGKPPYRCDIRSEGELSDPSLNLACGVRILTNLTRDEPGKGVIGGTAGMGRVGAAHYWSTLRIISEKPKHRGSETRIPIMRALAVLPACHAQAEAK